MKIHIFIATTQGLVAIQNIMPIDDEDISSVVSVNGTSTTANISGSYHNFVKKGVGIIHQMFGACSYRVDISARIDQGNSWQVAMYLAHLTQSKGLLGNGEVNDGDTVICATGEVNTTNHQILAVAEVALKFKLAQPQLDQWALLGAKVHFLLPQANQTDVKQNNYTLLVSNLDQAASALPSSTQNRYTQSVKNEKLVAINPRYIIAGAISILVLVMIFGLNKLISTDDISFQPVANKTNVSEVEPIKKVQLFAVLKQNKSCAQTSSKHVLSANKTFAELALNQLCKLYLQTHKSQGQVLLVARDAYTVIPLNQSQQGWQVPLPKKRVADRSYFLVQIVQTISEAKIEQLRLYREAMPKPNMLTESTLMAWLQTQGVEFSVYSHKLVVQ
jgi:hypothetical protein